MDNEYLLEKLAEQFTEDELEEIIYEVEDDNEVEKVAAEHYELGQIMAIGFQDELEKEASIGGRLRNARDLVKSVGGRLKRVARGAGRRYTESLERATSPGTYIKHTPTSNFRGGSTEILRKAGPARPSTVSDRFRAAGSAISGLTSREARALRLAGEGGAIAGGVVGAAGASGAAGRAGYKAMREKNSYDQGVEDLLDYLGLDYEDLE